MYLFFFTASNNVLTFFNILKDPGHRFVDCRDFFGNLRVIQQLLPRIVLYRRFLPQGGAASQYIEERFGRKKKMS